MKNRLLISESEKERILGLHQKLIKESRLNEQKLDDTDNTYVYQNKVEKLNASPVEKTQSTDSSSIKSDRILASSYENDGNRGALTKDDPKVMEYTQNLDNYPKCVQKLGKVIKLTKGLKYFAHAIQGEGQFQGFYFYPLPWMWDYDGKTGKVIRDQTEYKDYPKVYQKDIGNVLYLCDPTYNNIYIGDKKYNLTPSPTRKIPKTEEDLTKSGYYLTIGDRGDLVKQIQKLLANSAEGYATMFSQQTKPGKTPFDGIFGKITQGVVKEYQKQYQIPPTGKVDNSTWEKLKNTRIRRDWDIKTGGWVFVDTSEPLSTVAKRDIAQIPTVTTPEKLATINQPGTVSTTGTSPQSSEKDL